MADPKIKKITKVKTKPKTTEPSFRTAFSSAKKSGKKTFNWNGKKYTTQTAEEKGQKMINKAESTFKSTGSSKGYEKLSEVAQRANENMHIANGTESKPLGKDLQKSTREINNSYDNIRMNGMEGGKKTKYGRRN